MNQDNKDVAITIIICLTILAIIGGGIYGYFLNRQLETNNFQTTIKDLSDEQKCIHICGFQFHNYFENYKFCVEKCDRISEREKAVN